MDFMLKLDMFLWTSHVFMDFTWLEFKILKKKAWWYMIRLIPHSHAW